MTHRECFHEAMAGEPTPWVPNCELGVWPQALERWHPEGLTKGTTRLGVVSMFEGEDVLLRLDRRRSRRSLRRAEVG